MNIKTLALGLALSCATAFGAHAGEILFTITGSGFDPDVAFLLPANPSPDVISLGTYFGFYSVPATIEGSPGALFGLEVYNAFDGGGFADQTFFDLSGAQIYSGLENDPTFVLGTYSMFNSNTGNTDAVVLTAVPEAPVWTMLLLGFAGAVATGLGRSKKGTPISVTFR